MKRTISSFFFERFSGYYDWLLAADFQIALRHEFLTFMCPEKGDSLIEFGSGPGNFLSIAAPRFKTVTGLDASRSMTARAKKRLGVESITNVQFVHANLDDYKPDILHSVLAGVSFLYLIENRKSALQKMVAAVLDGGSIALMEPSDKFCATTVKRHGKEHDFGLRDRFSLHNWLRSVQFHGGIAAFELQAMLAANDLCDIVINPALSGMVLFARAVKKG